MAIGERIHFFRTKQGMTQKYLGREMGFPEKSADVRMAQYETGSRTPKADLTQKLADYFDISTAALTVPDIDTYIGLMHTLFTLEDRYGLTPFMEDGVAFLRVDTFQGSDARQFYDMLYTWAEQTEKLKAGEITQEDYDRWRYTYPKMEAQRTREELDALREKRKAAETDE